VSQIVDSKSGEVVYEDDDEERATSAFEYLRYGKE
jgi:hypothetical protein